MQKAGSWKEIFSGTLRVPGEMEIHFIRLGGGEDGRAVFSETDAFE